MFTHWIMSSEATPTTPTTPKTASFDLASADINQLYTELKRLAHNRIALEGPLNSLQTTALVHEAWLRLEKSQPHHWRDRAQFFAAAAEAMRRILVEAARKRLSAKRGSGLQPIGLTLIDSLPAPSDEHLLALHEALDLLQTEDPLKAQIVQLRFFSGMDNSEIAALLGFNEKTVRRHWTLAKVWLYRQLKSGG
jgi:RNA polymerase sigma factor (TIGR02999 family)